MFPNIRQTDEIVAHVRRAILNCSLFSQGNVFLTVEEILQECKYARLGICTLMKMASRKITEDLQIDFCIICEGLETRIELYPCRDYVLR